MAAVVVTVGLGVASAAMLLVLYHTLQRSTEQAAQARAAQLVQLMRTDEPRDLDPGSLGTDGQIGAIQILDHAGAIVAGSVDAPAIPLTTQTLPPGQAAFLGRRQFADDRGDFWVIARGGATPAGPMTVVVGGDREPVESVIATVSVLLGVSGPLVVMLVAWATHVLIGAALRPVERIRARVASISTARLDERVPVPPTGDEIAHLAETMNEMLARLQSGHAAQRRFVSDASHELRSPLATISTALELAHTRPDLLDDELLEESLLPETRRMRDLIDDLLLLARADEHQLSTRRDDVDLDEIADAERQRLQDMSRLTVLATIAHARVTGDVRQLARMMRNLVDNAARHAEGTVELSCGVHDGMAIIRVADDGSGIPLEQRTRVFDRFVRLDTSRARDVGGSGLGLAIVAEIVAAHRGTITIDDRRGGGACVTVRLPADAGGYVASDASR
jgi:signal transduction histidine kinase